MLYYVIIKECDLKFIHSFNYYKKCYQVILASFLLFFNYSKNVLLQQLHGRLRSGLPVLLLTTFIVWSYSWKRKYWVIFYYTMFFLSKLQFYCLFGISLNFLLKAILVCGKKCQNKQMNVSHKTWKWFKMASNRLLSDWLYAPNHLSVCLFSYKKWRKKWMLVRSLNKSVFEIGIIFKFDNWIHDNICFRVNWIDEVFSVAENLLLVYDLKYRNKFEYGHAYVPWTQNGFFPTSHWKHLKNLEFIF